MTIDNQELEEFREMARAVIAAEISPNIEEWERAGVFPAHDLFPELARHGLLGLSYDPADGGEGAPLEYQMVFAEELGRAQVAGVAMAINVQTHMATPSLAKYGSAALRERYLRPTILGEQVAAIAVTEPGAGSDVAGLTTAGVRDGDDWVITGEKTFITNATQADWFCMLVRTSDEGGYRGMSQIIVPANSPGFEVVRTLEKLGNRSSDTAELRLVGVRVPVSNTIGEIGRGFQQQMGQFVIERLSASFSLVGGARRALERTRDYLQIREAFGAPLATRQYPVFKLTELSAEVELIKAMNEKMCRMLGEGLDITREATVAKLAAGRTARRVADAAVQFHGGLGYMEENWTARNFRDARLMSIGGGTDEIMLQVLAQLDGYHM